MFATRLPAAYGGVSGRAFPTTRVRPPPRSTRRVNASLSDVFRHEAPPPQIDFGTLSRNIRSHKVDTIVYNRNSGNALVTMNGNAYSSKMIMTEGALDDIVHHNVRLFVDDSKPPDFGVFLSLLIPIALYFAFFNMVMRNRLGGGEGGDVPQFMKQDTTFKIEEDLGVTFEDVAGVDTIRDEVAELVSFVERPGAFHASGATIPRGCLLSGKPGTGKTLLAKAIAAEAGVPFLAYSASQFVEVFVGVGALRVRSLFEAARKAAPCILFIDEIDAIGKKRSGATPGSGGNDEREQTLNQLLTEMDGFHENEGIVVLAATNRLEILDSALTRPGRFDRTIALPLPDVTGRLKILDVHAKNKTVENEEQLKRLAQKTAGWSGAQLQNVMNEAAILAARHGRKVIEEGDIDEAFDKVTIGLPSGTTYSLGQKRRVAYHEAGHAVVGVLCHDFDHIDKVTILPRGNTGGVTMFIPQADQVDGWYTRQYLQNRIRVALAGHAAEELMFGEKRVSNGAVSDLQVVTHTAKIMVEQFGFSDGGKAVVAQDASDASKSLADRRVRKLVDEEYAKVMELLTKYRRVLERVADKLVEKETLTGVEVKNAFITF